MGKRFTVDTPMVVFNWDRKPKITYNKKITMKNLDDNEFIIFDNPMLDVSISEIDFTARESRGLKNGNMFTLRDIVEKYPNAKDMKAVQGIGVTSIASIYDKLKEWQVSVLPRDIAYN